MEPASIGKQYVLEGRFAEAEKCLLPLPQSRVDAPTALLQAQVLEMTGKLDDSFAVASRTLRSKTLMDRDRSHGEFILSRLAAARGDITAEANHLQRAIALAERAGDAVQLCWAQLRLVALLANYSGTDSSRALLQNARHNIGCVGDGSLMAALHLIVADVDGKGGLLTKALRHLRLAQSLLERFPNVWLEAWAESALLAISILRCEYRDASRHAERALRLAHDSGSASIIRSVLGNLGQLHFTIGDFDRALNFLDRAAQTSVKSGEQFAGILDSMARVQMALGNLEESERLLTGVRLEDSEAGTRRGYVYRHSLVTKAEVLARRGRVSESHRYFQEACELAERNGDVILRDSARQLMHEINCATAEARQIAAQHPLDALARFTPDSIALYERVLASRLVVVDDNAHAVIHRARAVRIYDALGDQCSRSDFLRAWDGVEALASSSAHGNVRTADVLLQAVAAMLMHAGRPALVAAELLALLEQLECIVGARAVARRDQHDDQTLAAFGTLDAATIRTFSLGTTGSRTIEVTIAARQDLESHATLNSLAFLLASVQDLDRARIEREERLALWPVDELPAEDDDSVVTGRMRDLMLFARKIAPTNINVLITGESGTGKEVLARALHRYSQRARKPFVPFNCTAVPRELLESQLFGYKRGAFTGADRDHPGLIRTARDGTLFLDEIGELGLDLQPKLLRFLESGEISPLGETAPLTVTVRIVAATNANLEQLVADGRFREDLYYRLNVMPLSVPPLRQRRDEIPALAHHLALKAASEFGKGRVTVGDEIMAHLLVYPWPGNIRQLSNELRRMVAIAEPDGTLTPDLLPRNLRDETDRLLRRAEGLEMSVPLNQCLEPTVARLEREMIKVALKASHGRVEAAAKALGISRKGLYLKRRRLGL